MFYIYILLMSNKKLYVGFSRDLKRRLLEHKSGGCNTTKKFLPIKLIFYECYLNKEDEKRRELYFKTSKGKGTLKIMLGKTLGIY